MEINKERLEFLKQQLQNDKVKVEVKPFISETTRGKVIYFFNDKRYGYQFNRGIAWVEKKDLHLFRQFPQYIIHDTEGKGE